MSEGHKGMSDRSRAVLWLGILAGAGALGAAVFVLNPSAERAFIAACEDRLIATLRAPSTYDRIEVLGPRSRGATKTEVSAMTTDEREAFLDADASSSGNSRTFVADKLKAAYVKITYDAANGFGTPIRGTYFCEQLVYGGQTVDPKRWFDARFGE